MASPGEEQCSSLQGIELTKGAKFTLEEIQTVAGRLRGAALPAWRWFGK